jgi:hypothetical protein
LIRKEGEKQYATTSVSILVRKAPPANCVANDRSWLNRDDRFVSAICFPACRTDLLLSTRRDKQLSPERTFMTIRDKAAQVELEIEFSSTHEFLCLLDRVGQISTFRDCFE